MTIEHILSESSLGGDPDAYVANIGNLILLDRKTNSEIVTNKAPTDKFKILKEMNYPMKESLISDSCWSNEQIENRTKKMAEVIYDSLRRALK